MNMSGYAEFVAVLLSIGAVFAALSLWRACMIQMTRERAFALRAKLFDTAADHAALGDEGYREMRLVINGMLRQVHVLSGFYYLYLVLLAKTGRIELPRPLSWSQSIIANDLRRTERELGSLVRTHLWLCGLDSFLVMILLASSTGMLTRVRNLVHYLFPEFEHLGRDDQYARMRMRSGWMPPSSVLTGPHASAA